MKYTEFILDKGWLTCKEIWQQKDDYFSKKGESGKEWATPIEYK